MFLLALGVLVASGFLANFAGKRKITSFIAASGTLFAMAICLVLSLSVLLGKPSLSFSIITLSFPFPSLSFNIDSLSAWFILLISILSSFCAIYGIGYMEGKKSNNYWLFHNLLLASMLAVVSAFDAIVFLFAWEVMALTSFFLVIEEHEKKEVRNAGFVYLVATHIGTLFLFVFFMLMCNRTGSANFADWYLAGLGRGFELILLFACAVIGFGTKAGIVPMHVWLPEAHPVAPSPISALMSGVMIKTGIYGIIRTLSFCSEFKAWQGYLLVCLGLLSALFGIILAMQQNNFKKLLAYSSVENMGIVCIALGISILGAAVGANEIAIFAFFGALLHCLNHSIFKGLLFLGSGVILHSTKTLNMDKLGGIMKLAPLYSLCILVACASICALPPLNGFVSEFLIYLSAFNGLMRGNEIAFPCLFALAGLALAGGLAVVSFVKLFGIVFLGEPRCEEAMHAHEPGILMLAPIIKLALLCIILGILSPLLIVKLELPFFVLQQIDFEQAKIISASGAKILSYISFSAGIFTILLFFVFLFRTFVFIGKKISKTVTWDCGYAKPSARMQYSSTSFVQPLSMLFHSILNVFSNKPQIQGFFPKPVSFATRCEDFLTKRFYEPIFYAINISLGFFRWIQHGKVQLYILYIAVTLLALLVWGLLQ
ncbi:MAG: proton-conducting transporter membrane subunit [Candidatus Nanoarchaeia archaeon]